MVAQARSRKVNDWAEGSFRKPAFVSGNSHTNCDRRHSHNLKPNTHWLKMTNMTEPGNGKQQEQYKALPQQSFDSETTTCSSWTKSELMDEGEYSILTSLLDGNESFQCDQDVVLEPNPVPIQTRPDFCSSIIIDDDGIRSLLFPESKNGPTSTTTPIKSCQIEEVVQNNIQKKRRLSTSEYLESGNDPIVVKKSKSDIIVHKSDLHGLETEESNNGSSSSSTKFQTNKGRWTDKEHSLFLKGLDLFGKGRWALIAKLIKTRTHLQVRTHAQKYFLKLSGPSEESTLCNTTGVNI